MAGAKYKIGDKVTIKAKRDGKSIDYLFSFTDEMVRQHGGKTYTIEDITMDRRPNTHKVPDDGYMYRLEGIPFNWASSMFVGANSSGDIEPFIRKQRCPEMDFSI